MLIWVLIPYQHPNGGLSAAKRCTQRLNVATFCRRAAGFIWFRRLLTPCRTAIAGGGALRTPIVASTLLTSGRLGSVSGIPPPDPEPDEACGAAGLASEKSQPLNPALHYRSGSEGGDW